MSGMASLHVSKEEAVQNIAALIEKVCEGEEIIIDAPESAPMILKRAETEELPDPDHDRWFRARVQEAIDSKSPRRSLEEMYAAGERRLGHIVPKQDPSLL